MTKQREEQDIRMVQHALQVALDTLPPGIEAVLIVAWDGPGDGKPISIAVKSREPQLLADTVANASDRMRLNYLRSPS
jgi:hypothetical protein